jgi:hypothetical protein
MLSIGLLGPPEVSIEGRPLRFGTKKSLQDDGSDRCASCKGSLDAELLATLRQIHTLPNALGSHPCEECGHPEMRKLPDGVFHCSACGSEVLPAYGSFPKSGGSKGVSEAYLSGWMDGLFGCAVSFIHNRELARWEDAADRLDYYRATAQAGKPFWTAWCLARSSRAENLGGRARFRPANSSTA